MFSQFYSGVFLIFPCITVTLIAWQQRSIRLLLVFSYLGSIKKPICPQFPYFELLSILSVVSYFHLAMPSSIYDKKWVKNVKQCTHSLINWLSKACCGYKGKRLCCTNTLENRKERKYILKVSRLRIQMEDKL